MSATVTRASAPAVSVRGASKKFASSHGVVTALDALSIDVMPGEIVVLLGPSGCGKSTLLRSIAGLETPDSGEILIAGTTVFRGTPKVSLPPESRGISMVFQSYALWPHLTVFENVAYPLRNQHIDSKQIAERVPAALETVGCGHLASRYPHQMSGGQQQRVALARAIIAHRGLILFDEPLSNVDAKVRERLRLELLELQRALGFAAVYVTHDQTEAMIMGSRVAVMESGKIAQIGTPGEIYDRPATRYVADFIGAATFLDGTVASTSGEDVVVRTDLGPAHARVDRGAFHVGDRVEVFFRPEHCQVSATAESQNSWPARIEASLYVGTNYEYVLKAGPHRLLAWTTRPAASGDGGQVFATVSADKIRVLPASDVRAPAR